MSALVIGLSGMLLNTGVFAADKLKAALEGDVADTFGSSGTFWTIYILVDIILAASAWVKSKNPMVFVGVFCIALIPGILIKVFVFK